MSHGTAGPRPAFPAPFGRDRAIVRDPDNAVTEQSHFDPAATAFQGRPGRLVDEGPD